VRSFFYSTTHSLPPLRWRDATIPQRAFPFRTDRPLSNLVDSLRRALELCQFRFFFLICLSTERVYLREPFLPSVSSQAYSPGRTVRVASFRKLLSFLLSPGGFKPNSVFRGGKSPAGPCTFSRDFSQRLDRRPHIHSFSLGNGYLRRRESSAPESRPAIFPVFRCSRWVNLFRSGLTRPKSSFPF